MKISFFALCPSKKVPSSGTDNRDLLQRDNYYYNLRLANPGYPDHSCAFMRPALARLHRNLSLFLRYFRALASIKNLCMPGLGQGHNKKRHLHALRRVSFMNNFKAQRRGRALLSYRRNSLVYPHIAQVRKRFSLSGVGHTLRPVSTTGWKLVRRPIGAKPPPIDV